LKQRNKAFSQRISSLSSENKQYQRSLNQNQDQLMSLNYEIAAHNHKLSFYPSQSQQTTNLSSDLSLIKLRKEILFINSLMILPSFYNKIVIFLAVIDSEQATAIPTFAAANLLEITDLYANSIPFTLNNFLIYEGYLDFLLSCFQ
jgi:hypothetical protein